MPYECAEYEFELAREACAAHPAGPPGKFTGVGVLDPPVPPKQPTAAAAASLFLRILDGLLLLGLASGILFLLFARG